MNCDLYAQTITVFTNNFSIKILLNPNNFFKSLHHQRDLQASKAINKDKKLDNGINKV